MFAHFSPFSALGGCIDAYGTAFCEIFTRQPNGLINYCSLQSNHFVTQANFIEFTEYACKASCGNCNKFDSRGWTNNKYWRLVLPIKRSHTPLSQERILEFFRCSLKMLYSCSGIFPGASLRSSEDYLSIPLNAFILSQSAFNATLNVYSIPFRKLELSIQQCLIQ